MTKPNCILQLEHTLGLELQGLAQIPAQRAIIDWQAMINAYAAEEENEVDAFWWPTALQRMQMSMCKNTFLQDEEGRVVGLNLYEGGLSSFPFDDQEAWQHLKVLFLAGNQLSSLYLPAALAQLEHLDVGDMPSLSSIIFEDALPNLKSIDASDSGLKRIRFLAGFSNLQKIDLSRTQLQELTFQADCPALEWLDLSGNQLSRLHLPLGFQKLQYLYLAKNPSLRSLELKEVPGQLEMLNVDDCYLDELPMETILSPHLQTLYAAGNQPKNIPYIFLGESNGENCLENARLWFTEIKNSKRTERNDQVKMMLLGNGSAGKSTLLCALEKGRCTCTDEHKSTHGVEMKTLRKGEVTFNIWDFGGQEIYHGTHRLFMQSPAVQLVLFDPQLEKDALAGILRADRETEELVADQPVEYWFETARNLSEKSQFLFVQNKLDKYPDEAPHVAHYAQEQGAAFRQVSAQKGVQLDELEDVMVSLAKTLPDYQMLMPASWLEVRDHIVQNIQEPTILNSDFEALCAEKEVNPSVVLLLRKYLHHSGFIYYHENLGDTIIIDQNWALIAIYKLFNRKEPYFKRFRDISRGQIMVEDIFEIFGPDYTLAHKELFLSFMQSCRICFKLKTAYSVEERIDESDVYVFTAFLPKEKNTVAAQNWTERAQDVHTFRLQRNWLNHSLIAAFISELGRKTDIRYIWRNGIQVETLQGWFKVEMTDYPDRAIVISIEQKALGTWLKPIFDKLELPKDSQWQYAMGSNQSFQTFDVENLEKEAFFIGLYAKTGPEKQQQEASFEKLKEKDQESSIRVLLFLAANPIGTTTIDYDREFRSIVEMVQEQKNAVCHYKIQPYSTSTFGSFIKNVDKWKPHIIHFVGHGAVDGSKEKAPIGQIIFHSDDLRSEHKVDTYQLKETFGGFLQEKYPLGLVFLNACLTAQQAMKISEVGLIVIGSNSEINSEDARLFAVNFYDIYREEEDVYKAIHYAFRHVPNAKKYLEIYQNGKKLNLNQP